MTSSPLQITPGGKDLSANFKAAARSGNQTQQAFSHLQGLCLSDALVSCLELADAESNVFVDLARQAVKKERPQFSVQLVNNGSIPQGSYLGITPGDYDTARSFILRVRAEKAHLAQRLWGQASDIAATDCFYPEFLLRFPGRRDRICGLADAHAGVGPHEDEQVSLFSLGGRYDYRQADAGTKPGGTTCILVARSLWHAAGCNVIWNGISSACNVPKGLDANLNKSQFGFMPASEYDKGMRPQAGDIFHIQGDPFVNAKGEKIDSTHVGVITNVEGDVWSTVEGGATDHVTRSNQRRIIRVTSPHGKWAFDNDRVSCGVRPLKGWYSVDRINTDKWMNGC